MRKRNKETLLITHGVMKNLAYYVMNTLIRKKYTQEFKQNRSDFWWLVDKFNKEFVAKCPEACNIALNSVYTGSRNIPEYYLSYVERK